MESNPYFLASQKLVRNAPLLAVLAASALLLAPYVESAMTRVYAQDAHQFKLQFSVKGPTLSTGINVSVSGHVAQSGNKLTFSDVVGVASGSTPTFDNVVIRQSGTKSIQISADYTDDDGDFAQFKVLRLYFNSKLPNLNSQSTSFPVQLDLAASPTSIAKAVETPPDCDSDDPCPPSDPSADESALLNLSVSSPNSPTLEID